MTEVANSEDRNSIHSQSLIAVYCMMAGFWSSNCSIQYVGPHEEYMPGQGQRLKRKSVSNSIKKPFEQLLTKNKLSKPVPFETLDAIHEFIARHKTIETLVLSEEVVRYVPPLDTRPNSVWVRHKSGLLIDFDVRTKKLGHRIGGVKYTSEPILQDCKRIDSQLTQVSTWGEAWVRWDTSSSKMTPSLEIFSDEIGLFTGEIRRYSIDDIDTLKRRSTVSFGLTSTKHFTATEMMGFVQSYLKRDQLASAKNCLDQAKMLGASNFKEIETDLCKKSIVAPPTVTHPLRAMKQFLTEQGMQIVASVQEDHELAFEVTSDYGRYPYSVSGVNYEKLVTAQHLEQEGFTVNTIATLFGRATTKVLKDTTGLFWFDAEGCKIWGCNETSWYFVVGMPNQLFGKKCL